MLLYQFQTIFIGILSFDLQKHPLRNMPEMSLTCIPPSTTTIRHKPINKKYLCGSCGIQHHMPKDLGEVPPTLALPIYPGNRHIDFGSKMWTLQ